ncbi:hypothetical protein J3D55_004445 [Chryseobacterium ginsenosidimutans]|nr:hypothetical protein [Chryseobacterium ginsenosidimutans]
MNTVNQINIIKTSLKANGGSPTLFVITVKIKTIEKKYKKTINVIMETK